MYGHPTYVMLLSAWRLCCSTSAGRAAAVKLPNAAPYRAMGGVGYFSAVSNVVQHMLAEVFDDEPFMEHYFAENSRRLGAAYAEFTGERGTTHLLLKVLTCRAAASSGS